MKIGPRDRPNLAPDTALFVAGTLLQFLTVYWAVPRLSQAWEIDTMAAWMLASVPLIFIPIIGGSLLILHAETRNVRANPGIRTGPAGGHDRSDSWRDRLWIHPPSRQDWRWALAALGALAAGSGLTFAACAALDLDPNPPFARNLSGLSADRAWMIAVWAVYWPFNILGENLAWRAVILPRMWKRTGRHAWLLNAALWGMFHLSFGIGNLIVLLPLLVLVPLLTQARRNTWLAVFLHAALSGPGFVALAFGLP